MLSSRSKKEHCSHRRFSYEGFDRKRGMVGGVSVLGIIFVGEHICIGDNNCGGDAGGGSSGGGADAGVDKSDPLPQ